MGKNKALAHHTSTYFFTRHDIMTCTQAGADVGLCLCTSLMYYEYGILAHAMVASSEMRDNLWFSERVSSGSTMARPTFL